MTKPRRIDSRFLTEPFRAALLPALVAPDHEAATALHQRMAHEAELGRLPGSLAIKFGIRSRRARIAHAKRSRRCVLGAGGSSEQRRALPVWVGLQSGPMPMKQDISKTDIDILELGCVNGGTPGR